VFGLILTRYFVPELRKSGSPPKSLRILFEVRKIKQFASQPEKRRAK